MPFSGSYASAPPSAPDTDLTDFVFVIDLADLPQSWWDDVDTSDGTKGRAAKDDGTTELATEWVEFNDVAETGFLWVKWSGTLASAGGDTIRIYPPKSANSSYAVTGTFGRNAVWTDFTQVIHFSESAGSTAPQFEDSSGSGNDITVNGTISDTTGQIGSAVTFTGSDTNYLSWPEITESAGELSVWVNVDRKSPATKFAEESDSTFEIRIEQFNESLRSGYTDGGNDAEWNSLTSIYNTLTHYRWGLDSGSSAKGAINDVIDDTIDGASFTVPPIIISRTAQGSLGPDGIIDEWRIRSSIGSDDTWLLEYDNQNDTTTFWGTWTFEAGSVGVDADLTNEAQSVSSTAGVGVSVDTTLSNEGQAVSSQTSAIVSLNTTLTNEPQSISAQSSTSFSIDGSLENNTQSVSSTGAVDISAEGSIVNSPQSVQSTITTIVNNVNVSLTNAPQSFVYEVVVDEDLQASDITDSGFSVSFSPAETKGATVSVIVTSTIEANNEPQSISSQGSVDVALDASVENDPQTITSTVTFTELNVSVSLTNASQTVESLVGDFEHTILELKSIIRDIGEDSLISGINGSSKISDISGNSDIDDILVSSIIESINLKSEL